MQQAAEVSRAQSFYNYVWSEENTEHVSATARALIGISAVYIAPVSAGVGAVVGGMYPKTTKVGLHYVDVAVNGVWNGMSHNQKIAATGLGLALCVTGGLVFSVPALGSALSMIPTIFSAKVGTEMALRNLERKPS